MKCSASIAAAPFVDPLCNVDLKTGIALGSRHRQPVRLAVSCSAPAAGSQSFLRKRRRGIRERPKNLIHLSVGINGDGSKIVLHQPDGLQIRNVLNISIHPVADHTKSLDQFTNSVVEPMHRPIARGFDP